MTSEISISSKLTKIKTNNEKSIFAKEKVFKVNRSQLKNSWTEKEDILLKELTQKYGPKKWNRISKFFENKSEVQCSARYRRILIGHKKGPWINEEDKLLAKYVDIHGKNWSILSKLMINRSGKQIRERYINNLDPMINREDFDFKEDKKIHDLYNKLGNKWTKISKYFINRTGDMIKNRYHSFIKKRELLYIDNNKNINEEKSFHNCENILINEEETNILSNHNL